VGKLLVLGGWQQLYLNHKTLYQAGVGENYELSGM
jgi:hypothetical protein